MSLVAEVRRWDGGGVDRSDVSIIAHRHHPVAAPVPDPVVGRLLDRLSVPGGGTVVDLGCGRGEWLRRLVAARPDVACIGVDVVAHDRFGGQDDVDQRIRWVTVDAAEWTGAARDAAILVGVGHVFEGLRGALRAGRRAVTPGGRVLLGDSFWVTAPSVEVWQGLGFDSPAALPDLPGMVAAIVAEGFEVVDAHMSTGQDWADYEWSWTGSLIEWALTEASAEDRVEALGIAQQHRRDWLRGYRGVLGFASFVLIDTRMAL